MSEKPSLESTLGWKIFFYFIAFVMFSTLSFLPQLEGLRVWDYIDLGFSLLCTAALYGYAFSIPIGSLVFWRYFFYACVIEILVYSVLFPLFGQPLYGNEVKFDIQYLASMSIALAMLTAVYRYAYRVNKIWKPK